MEPERRGGVHRGMRNLNWTVIALSGGLILLVVLIAYFATNRSVDQDKLTNKQVATATPPTHDKLCASPSTYALIKTELFRRAAQLRGSDQAAYDRLASYAVVRMENPVMESEDSTTGAVNCSGSLALDLPPGVAVVGGRRTLTSDLDYTVQQAADGTGTVVLLRNADAIITPLATLARTVAPEVPPAVQTVTNEGAPAAQPPGLQQPTTSAPPTTQGPPVMPPSNPETTPTLSASVASRPSFSCAGARTRGEIAVCGDTGLAALDRNMATEYRRAGAVASPDQQDLLRQSARRFYAYRDRCPNRQCIADAYVGRMREIRDIVEGRWEPPPR